MSESFLNGRITLRSGDSRDVLKTLADNSIDSIVTDPPYALVSIVKRFGKQGSAPVIVPEGGSGAYARASSGFMGKQWDTGETAFAIEFWAECLRVLKPGGHVVAFSGTRTYHRMACAIEDAGFEIRDSIDFDHDSETEYNLFEASLDDEQRRQFGKLFRERGAARISWKYGSGFPKSHSISQAIPQRCMCSVPLPPLVQAPGASRPILQQNVRGSSKTSNAVSEDLCGVFNGMDAEDARTSRQERNLLANMRQSENFNVEDGSDNETKNILQPLRSGSQRPSAVKTQEAGEGLLQPFVQSEIDLRSGVDAAFSQGALRLDRAKHGFVSSKDDGTEKSGMEGRRHIPESSRQLRCDQIRPLSARSNVDGSEGWLCDGAQGDDGASLPLCSDADGMCASSGSQSNEQRSSESGTLAGQPQPQIRRAWDHCGGCGKPVVPNGLGTALKPATEPICLARKPLSEKTVAANVLRWGTGAINIDGCRVEAEDGTSTARKPSLVRDTQTAFGKGAEMGGNGSSIGRWPANILHDGSDEVIAAFPETNSVTHYTDIASGFGDGREYKGSKSFQPDSGSAARFFYTAKADASDRLGSKHPTVKPVDLMQWLCRLVTPKGGTILDPFAGTGTTGEAAFREGFNAILIEREEEYQADIRRRMALCMAGPDERKRESIKAKIGDLPFEAGSLFA